LDLFWVDEKRGIYKTYTDLLNDIKSRTAVNKYIYFKNTYEIFLELIINLIYSNYTELLDSDFSIQYLESIGIEKKELFTQYSLKNTNCINSIDELFNFLFQRENESEIALYTSGTTGKPKKVIHKLKNIIRTVKIADKFKNNVWAFAYNPTHFAGLQVFFQAFFNKNPMIYIFDEEREKIPFIFEKYKITNISATPTFYRMIIPHIKQPIYHVTGATSGGEKFDSNLIKDLNRIFPNAKVRNIYASTEAGSIFTSDGEIFTIKDKYKPYILISEDGELLISEKLLGYSEDFELKDGWYHTGDIVEKIEDDKIKFVSRKKEIINVGGYNVNPSEVESEILKIPGVVDVRVYGRENKLTGNIIVAELISDKTIIEEELKKKIYKVLGEKLQKWKIPRIIKFVDEIDRSRAGKKVRK
jgi:acyl-coenzyme A synthetase/AMP-(fatty) acid ligase